MRGAERMDPSGRMNSRQRRHAGRLRGLSVAGRCHAGTGFVAGQPPPGVIGGGASLSERRGRRAGSAIVLDAVDPSGGGASLGERRGRLAGSAIVLDAVDPSDG